MGLEPTSGQHPPPVFKTGSSSGRMTSVVKLRELESNQRHRVQSPASLPAATIPQWMSVEGHVSCGEVHQLRGQESNLRTRGSKPRISTSRNYPAMRRGTGGTRTHARVLNKHLLCRRATVPVKSALWESNPPVQLGRLTPLPIGQGHMFLFKAEAVGLEPTTGVSHPHLFSRQAPHPAG